MKNSILKTLLLSFTLILLTNISDAQSFVNSNSKKKAIMWSLGTGFSGAEMKGFSIVGFNVSAEAVKPFIFMGKNSSISFNVFFNVTTGSITEKKWEGNRNVNKESFEGFPTGLITLNFNAYALSSKVNRSRLGGTFGLGVLVLPNQRKMTILDSSGEPKDLYSGLFGPALVFGPSFKIGKSYLNIRFYGGMTMGSEIDELTFGGMSAMYVFGMKKKKVGGMR